MPQPLSRRQALTLAALPGFGVLSSCRLRLEDDVATEVGAQEPTDLAPLQVVRKALVASSNGVREPQARQLMQEQRRRLNATIQALGGDIPEDADVTRSAPTWPASAKAWLDGATLQALTRLSSANAPMAFAIGATNLAFAQHEHAQLQWPNEMTFPDEGAFAVAQAADAAAAALEWVGAREKDKRRTDIASALTPLYAARSLAQTGAKGTPTAASRTYSSTQSALKVAQDSLRVMQAECAKACAGAAKPAASAAVLFAWASANSTLRFLGVTPGAFDGLTEN